MKQVTQMSWCRTQNCQENDGVVKAMKTTELLLPHKKFQARILQIAHSLYGECILQITLNLYLHV